MICHVKNFVLNIFAENRMTLWCTVAKLWCCKLCVPFLEHPVQTSRKRNVMWAIRVTALFDAIQWTWSDARTDLQQT